MGSTDTAAATTRFDVASRDGTSIAVWVDGEGQPLVMVHGSLQDHTASGALVDELRADTTTFALDRRGLERAATGTRTRSSASSRTSRRSSTPSPDASAAPSRSGALLRRQLRDGRRRPHAERPPSRALRAEPRAAARRLAPVDRAAGRRGRARGCASRAPRRRRRHDRRRGAGDAREPVHAVGGTARDGANRRARVPRRGGVGLPSRAVRRHRGADAAAGGLREPARRAGVDGHSGRGDPERADPRARRRGTLRASERPRLVAGIIREFVGT